MPTKRMATEMQRHQRRVDNELCFLTYVQKAYLSWKKVGILATGCRRYGLETMQSGKKRRKNQPKIKGKIRLISKDNLLVAVVFEIFFQV